MKEFFLGIAVVVTLIYFFERNKHAIVAPGAGKAPGAGAGNGAGCSGGCGCGGGCGKGVDAISQQIGATGGSSSDLVSPSSPTVTANASSFKGYPGNILTPARPLPAVRVIPKGNYSTSIPTHGPWQQKAGAVAAS